MKILHVFPMYLIFTLLIGFILFRGIRSLIPILKRKLENYKKSEYYAFKQVQKTLKLKDYNAFLLASHSWIKKLNPKPQSLHDLPSNNKKTLTDVLNSINDVAFKQELAISDNLYTKLLNTLTESRKTYLKKYNPKRRTIYKSRKWLNPFSDL